MRSQPGRTDDERAGLFDNAPVGADGDLQIFPVPWVASQCSLCRCWHTRAKDLIQHFEVSHPVASLRFRCAKCGSLFSRWHGATVHHAKCRGPTASPPGGFPCPDCDRRFPSQRGLKQRRNHHHPVQRNEERMRPQAERPQLRGSSVWTNEEDLILIEKYNEFRPGGRIQGYSLFVAAALPRKTEKQVRDRVRTLRAHGILVDAPRVQVEEPRSPEAEEGAVPEPTPPVEDPPRVVPLVVPLPSLGNVLRFAQEILTTVLSEQSMRRLGLAGLSHCQIVLGRRCLCWGWRSFSGSCGAWDRSVV